MFSRRQSRRTEETPIDVQKQIVLLEKQLAEIDSVLHELGDEAMPTSAESETDNRRLQVDVVVGNSAMVDKMPGLIKKICSMVNRSYGYMRVDEGDIADRLQMGDPGSSRANRVLHVAFMGDQPVGCMSSTFRVPWAEDGCGHWGLLVVDESLQGKGIASRMVQAAEARLAGMCEQIQMEYEYTPGDELSERLLAWYEGKLNFRCVSGPPRGRGPEFRKCRKLISKEDRQRGRRQRLNELRSDFSEELAALRSNGSGGYGGSIG
eukprot:TRINITY_DN102562_c0_g1_i1.p1 TRINITY_DN102562_c0_g1~~TRINITY_DN102562_c0_g1_i1.p1  ORF type:complete len:264 (+),score=50.15 TRINITY_DN102562_c0_g1_i1:156-947(+)